MKTVRRLSAVGAIVACVVLALAGPAGAHAVLEEASPGPNTTLTRSPRSITLTFSEHVDMRRDDLRLLDENLDRVDLGPTRHPGGVGSKVTATVPRLAPGLYTVAWRAISADSHPVQGAYTFGVGVSATGKAAADLTARAQAGEQNDAAVGLLLGVMRWGVFAGLAMVIGGAFFVMFLWPSGRTSVATRRLLLFGIELCFLATVGGLLLQGPYTSGNGLTDVFGSGELSTTLDTRFGTVWVARLVLLVVMALLLRLALRKGPRSRAEVIGVAVVAVLLAATPALAGHASAGRWVPLAVVLDVLHVLAMSIWIGGLLALVLARHDDVAYPDVTSRFSGVALAAVVVVVLTGVVQTIRQVQPLSDLWSSTYGAVLLAKLAAFAGILAVASGSRRMVHGRLLAFATVPRLDEDEDGAAGPPSARPVPDHGTVATLVPAGRDAGGGLGLVEHVGTDLLPRPVRVPRRGDTATATRAHARRLTNAVIGEIVFAAIVLAFTAILVNTSPPHSVRGPQPINGIIGTGATRFETYLGPAEVGRPNDLHVTAINRNGLPQAVVDMQASIANPSKDVPEIAIKLRKFPGVPGHYLASGIQIPPGDWTLTVTAYPSDVDEVTATAEVHVG